MVRKKVKIGNDYLPQPVWTSSLYLPSFQKNYIWSSLSSRSPSREFASNVFGRQVVSIEDCVV